MCRSVTGRQAIDARNKLQILDDSHLWVQRGRFRQVSGSALSLEWLLEHVEPGDTGEAFRGRLVARQDAHCRCLAGSVRPQEPENFSTFDLEAQVIYCRERPVAFGHVLHFDHDTIPPENECSRDSMNSPPT